MGRSRLTVDKALTAITTTRNLTAQRLNRDYLPSYRRLQTAYNATLETINAAIGEYGKGGSQTTLENTIKRELATLEEPTQNESVILQESGVKAGVDLAVVTLAKGGVDTRTTTATRTTAQAAVDYVTSQAFVNAVEGYAGYHTEQVISLILLLMGEGANPNTIAAAIFSYFNTAKTPLVDIENLTRTLQNYSARKATSEVYKANGIKQWVWVANIGNPRTCLACVMMHGTLHDIDKEPMLNDHHRGRCAMAPLTPTWAELGIFGGKDLRYPTGQQYFDSLSDTQKRLLLGAKLFEAYQRGAAVITPATVVGTYSNPIFGEMRRRNTNEQILTLS